MHRVGTHPPRSRARSCNLIAERVPRASQSWSYTRRRTLVDITKSHPTVHPIGLHSMTLHRAHRRRALMTSYIGSRQWRRGGPFGLGAAGALWALIELALLGGDSDVECYPYWALLVGSLMYLAIFGILEYVGSKGPPNRAQYGWVALLIGADGRLSTSKTQAVLWTV